MEDLAIDPWAVLVAAVAAFVVGGLWYSALFAKRWQREVGLSDEQVSTGAPRVFVGSFVLTLVMAASLAAFIGAEGVAFGAFAGAAAGFTFVGAAFGMNYLFARRSLALFAIDGGYNAVTFTLMGVIVGAMQA